MPEIVNTSAITHSSENTLESLQDQKENVIEINDVSMIFNIASETLNNLKEYAIALMRRELKFKEFRALDHISLEVKKGDVFGILGTNGSGKSTLLKIIAGVLEPSEGTSLTKGSIAPLIELGAGFDMELTARENIYLNGALLGYSKEFINNHFDEIVEFAEISNFLDMPLKNYSSGMVARIAFAIATAIVPDVLIVDEVLSVGDTMFQQKCERRIQSLINDHQITVLIVSHDTNQVERLCNKAAWIEKGKLRICGDAQEVCNIYRLVGGHTGSAEAEKQVLDTLFEQNVIIDSSIAKTISGESRYSVATTLARQAFREPKAAILVPIQQEATAFIAQALSSQLQAPVLPTPADMIPDIIQQYLAAINPYSIVILGDESAISALAVEQLSDIIPQCSFARVEASNLSDLSFDVYFYMKEHQTKNASLSDTAFLSYEACTGDLVSLSGYTFAQQSPLFLSEPGASLSSELVDILKTNFRRVIVVGGEDIFPEQILEPLSQNGLNLVRICGKNAYDANLIINDWLSKDDFFDKAKQEVILTPCWRPENSFIVGSYAGTKQIPILLEDPENLDCVSLAMDYLKSHAQDISTITFLGNDSYYSITDRNLLAKTLQLAKQAS